MQSAANFGAITLRDGSVKAKVQLLPFEGDEYGVFAFVDSVLLLDEAQCSEWLSLTQRLMANPMVRSAVTELVAVTDTAIAQYEAESADECSTHCSAAQRRRRQFTSATCETHSTVSLRRPKITSWWPPSRCRASRASARLMAPQFSSSSATTVILMLRGAARRWAGPLPVSRRSPPSSSEKDMPSLGRLTCGYACGATAPPHANPG